MSLCVNSQPNCGCARRRILGSFALGVQNISAAYGPLMCRGCWPGRGRRLAASPKPCFLKDFAQQLWLAFEALWALSDFRDEEVGARFLPMFVGGIPVLSPEAGHCQNSLSLSLAFLESSPPVSIASLLQQFSRSHRPGTGLLARGSEACSDEVIRGGRCWPLRSSDTLPSPVLDPWDTALGHRSKT